MDVVVTDHHSPRADGVLPDAPLVHPRVNGYPCAGPLRGGRRAQARPGAARAARARTRRWPTRIWTWSRWPPWPTSCRCRARTAASSAQGLQGARGHAQGRAAGADGRRARGPERARRVRDRLPARPAAERRRAALPRRCRARAAADRGPRPRAGRRRRSSTRSTPSAATWRPGSASRPRRWSPTTRRAARSCWPAEGWHPGVIGIVASRIAERHHRPAILIALDGEEGSGSGRSIPAFDLLGGLHAAAPATCCATAATRPPRA